MRQLENIIDCFYKDTEQVINQSRDKLLEGDHRQVQLALSTKMMIDIPANNLAHLGNIDKEICENFIKIYIDPFERYVDHFPDNGDTTQGKHDVKTILGSLKSGIREVSERKTNG